MIEIQLEVETKRCRLDLWLSQQIPDISRSRLQKLIKEGQVLVNHEICTEKKRILEIGDDLKVIIPPPKSLEIQPEESIPLDILYEDESLIIVNKQAGLVVHPAPGHWQGTLVNALLAHVEDLTGIGGVERPGIVHRIDKDTTGAMVIAKTDHAQQNLQAQIKAKTARREYWAMVYGAPKTERGTISQPIGRHPINRKKMAVVPLEKGGREAVTHWFVLERLGNYTFMEFHLETGRTHQIRVHSAFMGHPIVGDAVYSSGGSVGVKLSGQLLHARKLSLKHPVTGELIEAVAPIPLVFSKFLKILRHKNSNGAIKGEDN